MSSPHQRPAWSLKRPRPKIPLHSLLGVCYNPNMSFRKSSYTSHEFFDGKHRFEHWYRDNTVYFITSRCRDKFPAFETEKAKTIFWDRFDHYATLYGFVPWVTSLLNNHYHTLGYLRNGENLGPMMQ